MDVTNKKTVIHSHRKSVKMKQYFNLVKHNVLLIVLLPATLANPVIQ